MQRGSLAPGGVGRRKTDGKLAIKVGIRNGGWLGKTSKDAIRSETDCKTSYVNGKRLTGLTMSGTNTSDMHHTKRF
jgi:hypothetical protein